MKVCPVNALNIVDKKVIWDEEKCVACDKCIRECDNLSTPKTKNYSVDDLFEEIKQVSPFIQGITVSGGECTLKYRFLVNYLEK